MYSRETLAKYIDIALNADAANGMVAELMGELEQIPVQFSGDSVSTEDLPKYVEEDEVFTENPNYKQEAKDFNIFDNNGNLMLTVSADRQVIGRGALRFTVPLSSPEDKEAFLDFCDRLQKKSAVKYPKDDEE